MDGNNTQRTGIRTGMLTLTPDTVPPPATLHIPEQARKKMAFLRPHATGQRKIGIVWSGSTTFKGNDRRALPLATFLPLAENPTTQLYSLQKGPPADDMQTLPAGPLLFDLAGQLSDFADTAAAIEHMDEIRMTDSSVFHLAGSLQKPANCLVRNLVYWPYRNLERWYPTGKLVHLPTDHAMNRAPQ